MFENQRYGTMTWRVVAGGLEVRMGVAERRAEVFEARSDKLRAELFGGGRIAAFEFPADGGPDEAINMNGERFERVEGNAW